LSIPLGIHTQNQGFFLSDISHLSDSLGQCSGVPPNLSLCSDTIWRLLFQKKNAAQNHHHTKNGHCPCYFNMLDTQCVQLVGNVGFRYTANLGYAPVMNWLATIALLINSD
jgi:hypothetical protein